MFIVREKPASGVYVIVREYHSLDSSSRFGRNRLGCLCYSPGEAGRNHSGNSPIWTPGSWIPGREIIFVLI